MCKWSRPVSFHPTSVSSRRKFPSSRQTFSSSHQRQLSFLAEQRRRAASLRGLASRRFVSFGSAAPSSCPHLASLASRRVACRACSSCRVPFFLRFRHTPPSRSIASLSRASFHHGLGDCAVFWPVRAPADRPDCAVAVAEDLSRRPTKIRLRRLKEQ